MAAFRHDIQALRAVAVALVVAFHVWPAHVRGGYIGVDVFFVISGYLITGHLVREVASTGRVDLPGFYARRARRLLPAASLTLVAVAVASYAWMPTWTWATTAADIAASTGYAENWMLVRRAVDYQAQNEAPSPLQHFWSLAVEEQFYFGWPLLVAGVAAAWRRWSGRRGDAHHQTAPSRPPPSPPHRAWYAVPMAAACAASFASALFYARARPEAGYFATHTRLYELGMGGLLAVRAACPMHASGLSSSTINVLLTRLRTSAALAGLTAIATSAALFTARTPFPGAAALVPTLGTAALLWAGEPLEEDSPAHALVPTMSHPALQYVGNISYSLYLAHWPVIVTYPFAVGRAVDGVLADGVLACVVSLALAHVCKRWWEDAFRPVEEEGKPTTQRAGGARLQLPVTGAVCLVSVPRKRWQGVSQGNGALILTLFMVTTTSLVACALYKIAPTAQQSEFAAGELLRREMPAPTTNVTQSTNVAMSLQRVDSSAECSDFFGLNATRPYPGANAAFHGCGTLNSLSVANLVSLASSSDHTKTYPNPLDNTSGAPPPSNRHHVVILGDSHAGRWNPAFRIVSYRLGLNITNLYKESCPPTLTLIMKGSQPNVECQQWNTATIDKVVRMRPSAVVMVAYKTRTPADKNARLSDIAAGIVQVAQRLVQVNIPILYIKSTPVMREHVPNCLAQEVRRNFTSFDVSSCSISRAEGMRDGIMEIAAGMYPLMQRLSFDDIFCPGNTCPPAVGNVVVYGDSHHVTRAFSTSLADALQHKLLEKAPHLGSK